ncbi:uncharacterized protein [Ptychodera flava]
MASLDDIRWSQKSYSIHEILTLFSLPKICKVTSGLYGTEDIETLGNLQIVRIHRQQSQRRVVAVDNHRGRHFSIPVNFDIPFEILPITSANTEPKFLVDILEKISLPQKVSFAQESELDAWYIGQNVKVDGSFGALTLVKTFMEQYLQANAINNGILDEEILHIPAYMALEFSIAEGLREGSSGDWDELQQRYGAMVADRVSFDKEQGNRDIAMYFPRNVERNQSNYSYIRPNRSIRISTKRQNLYDNRTAAISDRKSYRPLPPTPEV